jgi:hypothetical protein
MQISKVIQAALITASLCAAIAAQADFTSTPVQNSAPAVKVTCADGQAVLEKNDGIIVLKLAAFGLQGQKINGSSNPGDCAGQLSPSSMRVECKVGANTFRFSNAGFAGPQLSVIVPGAAYPQSSGCKM